MAHAAGGRIAGLKLIHDDRLREHLRAVSHTSGVLFNRPNPVDDQHDYVHAQSHDRGRLQSSANNFSFVNQDGKQFARLTSEEQADKSTFTRVSGHDWTSVDYASNFKYQIPLTSVVNKTADFRICGLCWPRTLWWSRWCCAWHATAAQYIWFLNLLCFLVHVSMCVVVWYFAYRRWDRDPATQNDHVTLRIYRLTQVPTQQMLDNNVTTWSGGWNLTNNLENDGFHLRENGLPINFASLVIAFFATSAIAHFWALIAGAFECCWFVFWRQMDDAFCWWRWVEYSISAPLMAMGVAITVGIREQNTLALIFMAMWSCIMQGGLLTEYVSVPKALRDESSYGHPKSRVEFDKWKASRDPVQAVDYWRDDSALKLISQTEWERDRPLYSAHDPDLPVETQDRTPRFIRAQRTLNYLRRMLPHVLGYFPCIAAWVVIFNALETAKRDVKDIDPDAKIPFWIEALVYGQFFIFMSFAWVQAIFQRLPPAHYWGSELVFCTMSLIAKLYLGVILSAFVFLVDGDVGDTLGGA